MERHFVRTAGGCIMGAFYTAWTFALTSMTLQRDRTSEADVDIEQLPIQRTWVDFQNDG